MRIPFACAALIVVVVAACDRSDKPAAPPPDPKTATSSESKPAASAIASASAAPSASSAPATRTDTFATAKGELGVTPIHHASLLFTFDGKAIYVDPTKDGNIDGLPKADYVFITDIHGDHMDPAGVDRVKKATTVLVGPKAVNEKLPLNVVLANGEKKSFGDFEAEAVPMYNVSRGPAPGKLFHDKGRGDGFVLTFGGKRVYVSGDTECVPEMKALVAIDVAFVCMNLPYTMPPSEAAECVRAFKPKVVFPYHYRGSNLDEFKKAVGDASEVRERSWY